MTRGILATARAASPNNYRTRTGLVLDEPNTSRMTATGVPSPVVNVNFTNDTSIKFGNQSQSVRINIGSASADRITVTIPLAAAVDITGYETFNIALYMPDQKTCEEYKNEVITPGTGLSTILYFSADNGATSFTVINSVVSQNLGEGWSLLTFNLTELSGAINKTNINWLRFTFRNDNNDGSGRVMYYGGLFAGYRQRPKLSITFDDGYDDHYTEGYGYMQPLGLKGCCLINAFHIDDANYCTSAQLQTMYANGWDMINHGGDDHLGMITGAAGWQTSVQNGKDFLASLGFTRGANIFGPAGGQYSNAGVQTLKDLGYDFVRGITKGYANFSAGVFVNRYNFPSRNLQNTDTFAAVAKPYIDNLIRNGVSGSLYIHELKAAGGSNAYAIAQFQLTIDYILLKQQQGELDVVTLSELYAGLDI